MEKEKFHGNEMVQVFWEGQVFWWIFEHIFFAFTCKRTWVLHAFIYISCGCCHLDKAFVPKLLSSDWNKRGRGRGRGSTYSWFLGGWLLVKLYRQLCEGPQSIELLFGIAASCNLRVSCVANCSGIVCIMILYIYTESCLHYGYVLPCLCSINNSQVQTFALTRG